MTTLTECIHRATLDHAEAIGRFVSQRRSSADIRTLAEARFVKRQVNAIRNDLENATPAVAKAEFDELDLRIQKYFNRHVGDFTRYEAFKKSIEQKVLRTQKEFSARVGETASQAFDLFLDHELGQNFDGVNKSQPLIMKDVQDRLVEDGERLTFLSLDGSIDDEGRRMQLERAILHLWVISPAIEIEQNGKPATDTVASLTSEAFRSAKYSSDFQVPEWLSPEKVYDLVSLPMEIWVSTSKVQFGDGSTNRADKTWSARSSQLVSSHAREV